MGQVFEDFVEFADMARHDYLTDVTERARELPLSEIIEGLNLDKIAEDIAFQAKSPLEKGASIIFRIPSFTTGFDILASPTKTSLYRDGHSIKEYDGTPAVEFYRALSGKIKKAIEEEERDAPF